MCSQYLGHSFYHILVKVVPFTHILMYSTYNWGYA